MSNIDKQALIAKIKKQTESFDTVVLKEDEANALLDELEAKDKRIAELEAKLQATDKLHDSAFRHGLQHGFSYGQTDDQAGFEKAIQAYGQQWKGE